MVRAVKVVPLAEEGYAGPRSFGGASAGSGRRVMGKVPSLVFDLDDEMDSGQHAVADHVEDVSVAEVKQKLQTLLEPWSEPGSRRLTVVALPAAAPWECQAAACSLGHEPALLADAAPFAPSHAAAEYMLLLHARFAREDCAKRGQPLTVPDLADTLRRLGYAVKMRTALGGGSGGACLRSLRHSFLTVSVSGPSGSMTYLLDPRFKEQVGRSPQPRARNARRHRHRAGQPQGGSTAAPLLSALCPPAPPTPPPSLKSRTPRPATRGCWRRWAPRW
jgi:hypothetical protein